MRALPFIIIGIFVLLLIIFRPKKDPKDAILAILGKEPKRWMSEVEILEASHGHLFGHTLTSGLDYLKQKGLIEKGYRDKNHHFVGRVAGYNTETVYRIGKKGLSQQDGSKNSRPLTPQPV